MLAAQLVFVPAIGNFWGIVVALTLYFIAFNVLEASLPSLVSKIAPAGAKGTAMGVYNTSQSLGLFVGGALGGVLAHQFGPPSVFVLGSILIGLWLLLALGMRPPPAVKNLMYHVSARAPDDARRLEQRLAAVLGVAEAVVLAEEGVAYLKVNTHVFDEQTLRQVLASTSPFSGVNGAALPEHVPLTP